MRCSQAQFLMSEALDGRLSSGKRVLLLQHLERCAACSRVQDELHEAQALVLSLPEQRATEGFREDLWERIRTGEGSHEAIFDDPVPTWTKVRYLATGAAAAALTIAAVHLFAPREPELPPVVEEAAADPADRAAPAFEIGKVSPERFEVGSVSPENIADLVIGGYSQSVRGLRDELESLPALARNDAAGRVRVQARRVYEFAQAVDWLAKSNYILFPPETSAELRADLRTVELASRQIQAHVDPDKLRDVALPLVPLVQRVRVDLPAVFCAPCVKDRTAFFREFLGVVRTNPTVQEMTRVQLHLVLPSGGANGRDVQFFMIRKR